MVLTNDSILNTISQFNNELSNIMWELQRKKRELEHGNQTINTLLGIVPICSYCKGIRNDKRYWKKLEEYVTEHTDAPLSHSICAVCLDIHYPDYG